jgi:carboxypeptidase Q
MPRMRLVAATLLVLVLCVSVFTQEPVDRTVIARIRSEGLERSQILQTFDQLVTVIGPRLTNSPAHRRAVDWTVERLKALGLSNVHTEPWEFGRGWTLEHFSVEMLEPRYEPLIGYPKGWSPSTNGRIVAAPTYLPGATAQSLASHAGKLRGAILMASPLQSYFIREDRPPASGDLVTKGAPRRPSNADQQALAAKVKEEGVGVTLEPNVGEHGTVFVTGRDPGPGGTPSVVLASEHYNLIVRLLEQKIPVRLAVDVQGRYQEQDTKALNVIAEIAGADPVLKDEIVMVGAHLDSWHTADGATDNADGVSTIIEAMRILKTLGVQPRRTIRAALWAGEEQGLLGSRAWVAAHLAGDANATAREKFSIYFNLDNGYPPISGFYLEGNRAMQPIMEAWLKPFADLGATTATLQGIGATDHLSFKDIGVPGFQAVQSYIDYDVRTHHTNMDSTERIAPDALKQSAVVMAGVLYQAAMRNERAPR